MRLLLLLLVDDIDTKVVPLLRVLPADKSVAVSLLLLLLLVLLLLLLMQLLLAKIPVSVPGEHGRELLMLVVAVGMVDSSAAACRRCCVAGGGSGRVEVAVVGAVCRCWMVVVGVAGSIINVSIVVAAFSKILGR
jgi:hypothetical protein